MPMQNTSNIHQQRCTPWACDLHVQAVKHIKGHRAEYEACYAHDTVEKQYQRAGLPPHKDLQDFLDQASQRTYWANNFSLHRHSYRDLAIGQLRLGTLASSAQSSILLSWSPEGSSIQGVCLSYETGTTKPYHHQRTTRPSLVLARRPRAIRLYRCG